MLFYAGIRCAACCCVICSQHEFQQYICAKICIFIYQLYLYGVLR